MNIIMNKTENNYSQWAGVEDILHRVVERFGTMNKNDYEVLLFHLLLTNKFNDSSDFAISRDLQIPESKVKRLRYEESLVFAKTPTELEVAFFNLFSSRSFKVKDADRIQFVVPDKMLRNYLNDLLVAQGSFPDYSFNSNIVTITANDFVFLLEKFSATKDDMKKLKKQFDRSGANLPQSIWESLGKLALNTAATITNQALVNSGVDFIKQLLESIKKSV